MYNIHNTKKHINVIPKINLTNENENKSLIIYDFKIVEITGNLRQNFIVGEFHKIFK